MIKIGRFMNTKSNYIEFEATFFRNRSALITSICFGPFDEKIAIEAALMVLSRKLQTLGKSVSSLNPL